MSVAQGPAPARFPDPWASDWGEDDVGLWQAFSFNGVRQAFRWIAAGTFQMGSPDGEHERQGNERQHEVTLTEGYWMAETACTQVLWQALMDEQPSHFKSDTRPVEQVSWEQVQGFIDKLNELLASGGLLPLGQRFRLPSEAEWEYACRAGTTTPFSFGENISPEQVNYDGSFPYRKGEHGLDRQETVEVASLPPNPWGLFEMHGNVWEWCQDWLGDYSSGPATDPAGPAHGERRVLRGGSWFYFARRVRSAQRYGYHPGFRHRSIGFRLASGPEQPEAGPAGER